MDVFTPLERTKDDIRPYVNVIIADRVFSCLLDSGASVSCFGGNINNFFVSFGFQLEHFKSFVTTADGKVQNVFGTMDIPVSFKDKKHIISFFVIPTLSPTIILGVDFWRQFQLAPQLFPEVDFSSINRGKQVNEVRKITSASFLSPRDDNCRLKNIIDKFETISFEKCGLGLTHLVQHHIETTGPPIKQRYYPLSPARQRLLEAELKEMLAMGVVRPSRSAWSSPVLLVTKKDGSARFCLDSRKINEVTKRDSYPLPYVSRIVDKLRGARFISSVDLSKAFWQNALDEASAPVTAFVVPGYGLYEFTRMPFGLKNAPSELQRLIDKLFGPEFDENVFGYVDDLILISDDFDSHLKLLQKVFERLKEAGLTINLKKSEFCKKEL